MSKGNYTVNIRRDATGDYFTLMTYGDQCVPGFPGRYFPTRKAAEFHAKRILAKV